MAYSAVSGAKIFNALKNHNSIILAANVRIVKGVATGIFRAAKQTDSAVFFELAPTECNIDGGYTGMTPRQYAESITDAANKVGFDIWTIHADHLQVKKKTPVQIDSMKKLIEAQVKAGYKSFAIDSSYLFNELAHDIYGQLRDNIEVTIELARFIEEKFGSRDFGLEVEVGEIGKTDDHGNVITSPEEAVTYIKALKDAGVEPDVLAIANGSTHGNIYDENGNPMPQLTIDIPRTIAVAEALKQNSFDVRIAQHGITGTPLDFIATKFPHGIILKGNVGTSWMNLVWDVFKIYEHELFSEIFEWTIDNHKETAESKGITESGEIFGLYGKYAIRHFFDRINQTSPETEHAVETAAYYNALMFLKAFNAYGSAKIVRGLL